MPGPKSSVAIFVVDDDEGLVRLVERTLRKEGHTTASATSAEAAIRWLDEHTADLLLLDLKLKEVDGREVVKRLEATQRTVPFIIITGQGDERVAVEMMKRGALDYLVKDLNFMEFLPTVVRRAVSQLRDRNRLAVAEAAARESQALTKAVLNALPAQIAVLDQKGALLAVNEPWARFAHAVGQEAFAKISSNYLDACRRAAASAQPDLAIVADTIEAVLHNHHGEGAVEFRQQTLDGERWFLMTVTPLSAAAGAVVIAHVDITERRALEAEVFQIAETERQRVAADLHDGICQELTGIGFTASALYREMKQGKNPLACRVQNIERAITQAVGHTRQVARGLNAVVADGHGLMHALQLLTTSMAEIQRVRCSFECRSDVVIEDPIAANELYRIAHEAMTNAARHGRAREVVVTLSEDDHGLRLSVADDGDGIPAHLPTTAGMGLRVMRYRASLIRGQLLVEARTGSGTEVICVVPKVPSKAEELTQNARRPNIA